MKVKVSTKVFWYKIAAGFNTIVAVFAFILWAVLNALCAFGNVPVEMEYHLLLAVMAVLIAAAIICNLKKENLILRHKRIHKS